MFPLRNTKLLVKNVSESVELSEKAEILLLFGDLSMLQISLIGSILKLEERKELDFEEIFDCYNRFVRTHCPQIVAPKQSCLHAFNSLKQAHLIVEYMSQNSPQIKLAVPKYLFLHFLKNTEQPIPEEIKKWCENLLD